MRAAAVTVVTAGVIAALYYGQIVLIPVALAILLSFLLTPVVRLFERLGIGRVVSVLAVGVLTYAVLGAAAWIVTVQGASLIKALPEYRHNIRQKVADVRSFGRGGTIERLQETVEEATGPSPAPPAAPVVVEKDKTWDLWGVPAAVGPWLAPLATAGLVAVLVPFILLERGGLTDRVIQLMGRRRLAITTKALDETAERVSRYLLMQSIINATYGSLVMAGLFLLGVPYAVLWGFLAAVLRFIPYVGPWIGALLPVALSLAVFPGWTRPALVAGLFVVLELFSNLVMETILYAGSAGVSQVALLIAVAFWTALWGPIGLVLATPLTVCLVVFGKHVPELRFLVVLMTDDRVVAPDVGFYQRILAGDSDEALDYLQECAQAEGADPYDGVLVPALKHARRDHAAGMIGAEDASRVVEAIARAADQLDEGDKPPASSDEDGPSVLGCPAVDRADEVALRMLARLVAADGIAMEVLPATLLTSEVAREIETRRPRAVLIGSLPPGGLGETRYLCKRLGASASPPWILVARWGLPVEASEAPAPHAAATVRSLAEARDQLQQFARTTRDATPVSQS
ncbi:MAG TPA: AI-2E family transporter [Methylomirabilota bacterium]|nr:AI-2E family transporter [Methylomirabilota bacterium]